jgi:peptidylprolyl isomerase
MPGIVRRIAGSGSTLLIAGALVAGCSGSKTTTTKQATQSGGASAVTVKAAAGEAVALPTVTGAKGAKPTIMIPEGAAPTDLQVKVLDEGSGAVVAAGQQISVHYIGVTWPGGAVFDNSYDRGAPATFPIGVKKVIVGWDEGLVGKKVGTRVLLSIPPEKGYGPNGNPAAKIKGTDTLVFVVEILAAK